MRVTPALRLIMFVLGLLLAGVAAYAYTLTAQVERAYVFAEDLPQYAFIDSSDRLKAVTIPAQRDFEAATDPQQIVGMYTGQAVRGGQLVQPALLLPALPDGRRHFEAGLLPLGTAGYPVPIPADIAALFEPNDLVDILVKVNQDSLPGEEDVLFPLFQKVSALESLEDGKLVVGLTYQQIAVFEGLKDMEGVSFTAAITQEANGDYPALYPSQLYPDLNRSDIRELFAAPTPAPTPVPTQEAAGS